MGGNVGPRGGICAAAEEVGSQEFVRCGPQATPGQPGPHPSGPSLPSLLPTLPWEQPLSRRLRMGPAQVPPQDLQSDPHSCLAGPPFRLSCLREWRNHASRETPLWWWLPGSCSRRGPPGPGVAHVPLRPRPPGSPWLAGRQLLLSPSAAVASVQLREQEVRGWGQAPGLRAQHCRPSPLGSGLTRRFRGDWDRPRPRGQWWEAGGGLGALCPALSPALAAALAPAGGAEAAGGASPGEPSGRREQLLRQQRPVGTPGAGCPSGLELRGGPRLGPGEQLLAGLGPRACGVLQRCCAARPGGRARGPSCAVGRGAAPGGRRSETREQDVGLASRQRRLSRPGGVRELQPVSRAALLGLRAMAAAQVLAATPETDLGRECGLPGAPGGMAHPKLYWGDRAPRHLSSQSSGDTLLLRGHCVEGLLTPPYWLPQAEPQVTKGALGTSPTAMPSGPQGSPGTGAHPGELEPQEVQAWGKELRRRTGGECWRVPGAGLGQAQLHVACLHLEEGSVAASSGHMAWPVWWTLTGTEAVRGSATSKSEVGPGAELWEQPQHPSPPAPQPPMPVQSSGRAVLSTSDLWAAEERTRQKIHPKLLSQAGTLQAGPARPSLCTSSSPCLRRWVLGPSPGPQGLAGCKPAGDTALSALTSSRRQRGPARAAPEDLELSRPGHEAAGAPSGRSRDHAGGDPERGGLHSLEVTQRFGSNRWDDGPALRAPGTCTRAAPHLAAGPASQTLPPPGGAGPGREFKFWRRAGARQGADCKASAGAVRTALGNGGPGCPPSPGAGLGWGSRSPRVSVGNAARGAGPTCPAVSRQVGCGALGAALQGPPQTPGRQGQEGPDAHPSPAPWHCSRTSCRALSGLISALGGGGVGVRVQSPGPVQPGPRTPEAPAPPSSCAAWKGRGGARCAHQAKGPRGRGVAEPGAREPPTRPAHCRIATRSQQAEPPPWLSSLFPEFEPLPGAAPSALRFPAQGGASLPHPVSAAARRPVPAAPPGPRVPSPPVSYPGPGPPQERSYLVAPAGRRPCLASGLATDHGTPCPPAIQFPPAAGGLFLGEEAPGHAALLPVAHPGGHIPFRPDPHLLPSVSEGLKPMGAAALSSWGPACPLLLRPAGGLLAPPSLEGA
ncbi:collagen alpha-1(I) chain-like [Choloepus didactylus]|uniref:collagen alpha-1(I) chain-like n=1 Tax=Choloepus didactylus TaxID=27675 RepID=UPI00189D5BD5|nr:collagen alpha-1(I) chain-like [Choloepus didactylus]